MRDGLANMNVSPKGKKAKMAPYQGLFFFGSSNFSLPASSNEKILCTLCLRRLDTLNIETNPAGLSLEFEIWRQKIMTDLISWLMLRVLFNSFW